MNMKNQVICDRITYGGSCILTVYHRNFSLERPVKKRVFREKIGRFWLEFREGEADEDQLIQVESMNWQWKTEGILLPGNPQNPYNEAACAKTVLYGFTQKPERLFKIQEKKYVCRLPLEDMTRVNAFVKKYMGVDPDQEPLIYGNILVCQASVCEYRGKGDKGIVIQNVKAGMQILVNFKKDGFIVCTKNFFIQQEQEEVEILSDVSWDSYDIRIYFNEELLYEKDRISYVKFVHMEMNIKTGQERIPLKSLNSQMIREKYSSEKVVISGKDTQISNERLLESGRELKKLFSKTRENSWVQFICPGETDKVIETLKDAFFEKGDEIWVFDPYFADSQKLVSAIDWLRVLTNSENPFKHVVYYCRKGSQDTELLKKAIQNDRILRERQKDWKSLNLTLVETKSPIHDRFILWKNNGRSSGISMGTSFNSLGENFYCIYRLPEQTASRIFERLLEWMQQGNIEQEIVL